jgi:hypothetical protein
MEVLAYLAAIPVGTWAFWRWLEPRWDCESQGVAYPIEEDPRV